MAFPLGKAAKFSGTRHVLTRLVLGCAREIRLTDSEFVELQRAEAGKDHAQFSEEAYEVLVGNYADFEKVALSAIIDDILKLRTQQAEFNRIRRECHRSLSNLLSAARAFVDGSSYHLARAFAPDLKPMTDFNQALRNEYEGSLGFRVLEALRNHAQHHGYSVGGISYGWNRAPPYEKDSALTFTFRPLIYPRHFTEDRRFKKSVLKELAAQHGSEKGINVVPFVREYIAGLSRAMKVMRATYEAPVDGWRRTFEGARAKYLRRVPKGEPTVGLAAVRWEGTRIAAKVEIFDGLFEEYDRLQKVNRSLSHLSRIQIQH